MFGQSNSIEQGTAPTHKSKQDDYAASRRLASAAWQSPGDASDGWEASAKVASGKSVTQMSVSLRRQRAGQASGEPAKPKEDAVAKQHGLYTHDRLGTRRYYSDYQQKSEAMRATVGRISTKRSDQQTVTAMLDLAQSRGWGSVKVKGTDDFRREAWVQAQVRGMTVDGYKPKQTDMQEAARRTEALAPVKALPQREAGVVTAPVAAKADTAKKVAAAPAPVASKKAAATEKAKQSEAAWKPVEASGQAERARQINKIIADNTQTAGQTPKAKSAATA